ncbi:hypothetical protein GCM10018792_75150 [Streptomyces rubradiris]|nr:hypothetical protein GCM10018792_75150 [Streptomyces rubradiris]
MAGTVQHCPGSVPPTLPVRMEHYLCRQVEEPTTQRGVRSLGELAVGGMPLLLRAGEVVRDETHD